MLIDDAELKEPDFLRRLKQQCASDDTGRHHRPSARPKRPRADNDDDGPTYVDEATNEIVSQTEYEALAGKSSDTAGIETHGHVNEGSKETQSAESGREISTDATKEVVKENVADVGNRPRKRAVKTFGEKDDVSGDEGRTDRKPVAKGSRGQNDMGREERRIDRKAADPSTKSADKTRKKKIKLSFTDDVNEAT